MIMMITMMKVLVIMKFCSDQMMTRNISRQLMLMMMMMMMMRGEKMRNIRMI